MKNKLTPFKIASIYVGTIVGAGFASGQEILQFFGFHGRSGVWGLLLSTALFIIFGTITFILGHRLNAQSHQEVVRHAAGLWLGTVIDLIITFFLLGAFSAMCAGAGAVFNEQFGISVVWGSLAMAGISIVTVLLGIQGVLSVIGFVAPFLITAVLTISVLILTREPVNWTWAQPHRAAISFWPLSAVTYASYNMVMSIAVLAATGALAAERDLRKGAFWGGLSLGVGALSIQLAIRTQVPGIIGYEVPMLLLVQKILGRFAPLYSIVLLAEVYTTAAGSLYGFAARIINPRENRFSPMVIAAGIVGFGGSLLGFSELVNKLYSAVGLAGIVLLVALGRWCWKNRAFKSG